MIAMMKMNGRIVVRVELSMVSGSQKARGL
jgi:hypothetical protein